MTGEAGTLPVDTRPQARAVRSALSVRQQPHQPGRPIDYTALSHPADAAASAEEEGFAAGYEAGHAEGRRRAAAEAEVAEHDRARRAEVALTALSRSLDTLTRSLERRQIEIEQSVPRFAFDVLDALFQRELALAVSPGMDAIERALSVDDSTLPVTVHLHPEDVATLESLEQLGEGRVIDVMADPSVEPGGAVVDIGETTVDSQLSAALDRVRIVMLGGDPAAAGAARRRGAGRAGANTMALRKALEPVEQGPPAPAASRPTKPRGAAGR